MLVHSESLGCDPACLDWGERGRRFVGRQQRRKWQWWHSSSGGACEVLSPVGGLLQAVVAIAELGFGLSGRGGSTSGGWRDVGVVRRCAGWRGRLARRSWRGGGRRRRGTLVGGRRKSGGHREEEEWQGHALPLIF
jgi:hypothetical protein